MSHPFCSNQKGPPRSPREPSLTYSWSSDILVRKGFKWASHPNGSSNTIAIAYYCILLEQQQTKRCFGPKWHSLRSLPFQGLKKSWFSGPTPSAGPCNGCCPHQNCNVPPTPQRAFFDIFMKVRKSSDIFVRKLFKWASHPHGSSNTIATPSLIITYYCILLEQQQTKRLFGPKWHSLRSLPFQGLNKSGFSGPTPSTGSCNGCCPHQNCNVPHHTNNKYIIS
jgi:hypothetical protein